MCIYLEVSCLCCRTFSSRVHIFWWEKREKIILLLLESSTKKKIVLVSLMKSFCIVIHLYIYFLILFFAWPNHLWDDIKYNFFGSEYYCCSTLHTHDKKQGFQLERSFLGNQPWYETKKRIITISYLNNNSDEKKKHISMHFIPQPYIFLIYLVI